MRNAFVLNIVLVLVCGVFGNTEEVKSVMEGDSVTLHTDLTDMKGIIRMMWRFEEKDSQSLLIGEDGKVADVVDKRFRHRLQVNNQTRDLTITNMRTKHSGRYQAEINDNRGTTTKKYRVAVNDAPDVIGAGTGNAKSMSVMEGESVTLHTDVQTHRDDLILWRFGDEGYLIAKADKEYDKSLIYEVVLDGRFRGRLKMDNKTGSLTITNTKATDSGVYLLKSSNSNQTLFKTFNVYVRGLSSGAIAGISTVLALICVGVLAAGFIFYLRMSEVKKLMNKMKSVSVTEEDSVTLHTDISIKQQSDDVIQWMFGEKKVGDMKIIAKVNKKDNAYFIYDGVFDGRFKDRLKLNNQTGSLTITKINPKHAGLYKVMMSSGEGMQCSQYISRSGHQCSLFNVVIQARMKLKSVMEGDSVTLPTDLKDKHTDAVIEWMFKDEDAVIARCSRKTKDVTTYDDVLNERFKMKLQVNDENGDLTITDVNVKHAGVYKLWIIASTGVSFSHFNVVVKERIRLAVLGQSVTLCTSINEIQPDDEVQWTFGPKKYYIARLNGGSVEYNDCQNVNFRPRLNLNQKTGSLTIANITPAHSGVYQVRIGNNIRTKYKKFSVTISVLVKAGESVTLNTEGKIQKGSEIGWISEDNTCLITGKIKDNNEIKYTEDERFKDKLRMKLETGDLTITDITTEHNGLYKLLINSDAMSPYRIFSICVIDSAHGTALTNQ